MSALPPIKILCSPPLRSVLAHLRPQLERTIRHALVVDIAPASDLKRRIECGEEFDVAIITSALIGTLADDGRIAAPTRSRIARAGLGVVVRSAAVAPDVGSVDAFRHALLQAASILYASGSAVLHHIEGVFARLGLDQELKPKSRTIPAGGTIAKAIANDEAELGLTTIPTILETADVRLAGPFPAALQFYVDLSGGISSRSTRQGPAHALLDYLSSPEASALIRAKGLER